MSRLTHHILNVEQQIFYLIDSLLLGPDFGTLPFPKVTASMKEKSNRQAICTPSSSPRMKKKVLMKSLSVHTLSARIASHTLT